MRSLLALTLLLTFLTSAVAQPGDTPANGPQNLTCQTSGGTVTLQWQAPSGDFENPTGYRIYRSSQPSGPFEQVGSLTFPGNSNSTNASFVDQPGAGTWYYQVTALNGDTFNESSPSNQCQAQLQTACTATASFTPTPTFTETEEQTEVFCGRNPCNLVCEAENGQIELTWSAADQDIFRNPDGYYIYRSSQPGGPFTLVQTLSIPNGSVHLQLVTAYDNPGPGNWCYEVQAFRNKPPATSQFTNVCCSTVGGSASLSPTFTPSSTPTNTPTYSPTFSPTSSPTLTFTKTPTLTSTFTTTNTPTNTPTGTATHSATNTPTSTPSATASRTPTSTSTQTGTNTATSTATNTPTNTSTQTGTNTPTTTATDTFSNSPTSTSSATATNTPTATATSTPTATFTSTNTSTATATNSPTNTPTKTATQTPTYTPTSSATSTPTNSSTPTPTASGTPTFCYQFNMAVGPLGGPQGVAVSPAGNIYESETGSNQIRYFSPNGAILGTFPTANQPVGMVFSTDGKLYVVQYGNQTVESFTAAGVSVNSWGGSSVFTQPIRIAVDSAGNLYVSDIGANEVKKFRVDGTLLQTFGAGQLNQPNGVAVDPSLNLYVAQVENGRIQVFNSAGVSINSWATGASQLRELALDGFGRLFAVDYGSSQIFPYNTQGNPYPPFGSGQLNGPLAIAADGSDNLWVASFNNNQLVEFSPCGITPTPSFTPPPPSCLFFNHSFNNTSVSPPLFSVPSGVAVDSSGNIYASQTAGNQVTKMDPNGNVLAQIGTAQLSNPNHLAMDNLAGEIYVSSFSNNLIQVFGLDGTFHRSIGSGVLNGPEETVLDGAGNLYVDDFNNNRVVEFSTAGVYEGVVVSSGTFKGEVSQPTGLARDAQGNFYVAEQGNERVSVFDPHWNFVRTWGSAGNNPGQFKSPYSIQIKGSLIFITDKSNNILAAYDAFGDLAQVLGGTGSSNAQFNAPSQCFITSAGAVFVADSNNARVQKFTFCQDITPTPVGPKFSLLPDLTVEKVDASGVFTNGQTLRVTGTVSAIIANIGEASAVEPFQIAFFEDTVGDGQYHPGVSNLLGTASYSNLSAGVSATVSAPVTGTVLFPGNVIYAFVDSTDQVVESDKSNNIYNSGFDCSTTPPSQPFNPKLKWSWTSSNTLPADVNVVQAPLVVDLNGTGQPDVVFVAGPNNTTPNHYSDVQGFLRALNGSDGSELFTNTGVLLNGAANLAVGKLSPQGKPVIFSVSADRLHVVAFNSDGSLRWTSAPLETPLVSGLVVADLDGSGSPAIIAGRQALNADGSIRWTGTGGRGVNDFSTPFGSSFGNANDNGAYPVVADINLEGLPQVIAGNTAYHHDGSILWQRADLPDGFDAVARFRPSDPYPQVVLVGQGAVWMLDHLGNTLWGPVTLVGGGLGGPPVIADMDGTGGREIGVIGASRYTVLNADGSLKWFHTIFDRSAVTGTSVFDFTGSGAADVVYRNEENLFVFSGRDGQTLFKSPLTSGTAFEYPTIASLDSGNKADIIVPVNNWIHPNGQFGIYVYEDSNNIAVGSRKVWNEHAYHITNVGEDGNIPVHEDPNWSSYNNFRLNTITHGCVFVAPDLTASDLRVVNSGSNLTLTARIGNGGSASVGAGVPNSFYNGDPQNGGVLLGTVATSIQLNPGQFQDVSLALPASVAATLTGPLWAVANDSGGLNFVVAESNLQNNRYNSGIILNAGVPQPTYTPGGRSTFTTTPTPSFTPLTTLCYQFNFALNFPSSPGGVAVDAQGNVYESEYNNGGVQVFSNSGAFLRAIPTGANPVGLLIGKDGNLYVAANGSHEVEVFTSAGVSLRSWSSGEAGIGALSSPIRLASDAAGNIYVADSGTNSVQEFQPDGTYLQTFGNGTLSNPNGVAVDGNGNVYVAQIGNNLVQVFNSSAAPITSWNGQGHINSPRGLRLDRAGRLFESDFGGNVVNVFDTSGNFITSIGAPGNGNGQFSGVEEVDFDPFNSIFTAEFFNNRLQKFSPCGTVPTATGTPTNSPTGTLPPLTATPTPTPSFSPSETFTSTPAPTLVPGAYVQRIAVAGSLYVDSQGQTWTADKPYVPNSPAGASYGFVTAEEGSEYFTDSTVDGTADSLLYQSSRDNSNLEYKFDVTPGQYQVTLKMAETFFTGIGQRVFSIAAQGVTEVSGLDLVNTAGYFNAYDVTFTVNVTSGPLDLQWVASVDQATLSAIQVVGLQAAPTATPTRTPVAGAYDQALNAGGPPYTDTQGVTWAADQAYQLGSFGYVQPGTAGSSPDSVLGTSDPTLYQTWRENGIVDYKYDLPPGNYRVLLKWADMEYVNPGDRPFNVVVNGNIVAQGLDVIANAGAETAFDLTINDIPVSLPPPPTVTYDEFGDPVTTGGGPLYNLGLGELDLQFQTLPGFYNSGFISAIRVEGEQLLPTATPTGAFTPPPTNTPIPPPTSTPTPSPTPNAVVLAPTFTFTPTFTGTLVPPTATSSPTPTLSPTASFTPVPGAYASRLEVVGPNVTDSQGNLWVTDQEYQYPSSASGQGGSPGWLIEGQPVYTGDPIAGAPAANQALFQYYRENPNLEYRFDLPNGQYQVTLNFAEAENVQAGARVFSVLAQGTTVISNLDIFATVGFETALSRTFLVNVADGTLDLQWAASVGNATLSSIQVLGLQVNPTATSTRTPVTGALDIPVNVGGSGFTDAAGKVWQADKAFTTPNSSLLIPNYGYVNPESVFFTSDAVDGIPPADEPLYQDWREGTGLEYKFTVPNGNYQVALYWNEIADQPGEYDFNVLAQGLTLTPNSSFLTPNSGSIDLAFEGPYFSAVSQTFNDVAVTNNLLDVQLVSPTNFAALAGIEVIGEQPNPTATFTSTPTATNTPTPTATGTLTPATASFTPTATGTPLALDSEIDFVQEAKSPGNPAPTEVPADGVRVTDPVTVIGTANGNFAPAPANAGYQSGWWLVLQPVSPATANPITVNSGTSQVSEGVLGILDPTLLLNGTYSLELIVVQTDDSSEVSTANISVDGNQKVGNFTLSFTDLNVPVSGLPMQVVRTYDSRLAARGASSGGDFGAGWTLDIHNIQVEESGVMGDGYDTFIESGGLLEGNFGQIFISPTQSHFVDVVLGNGKVYSFEPHFLDGSGNDVTPGGAGEQDITGGTYDVVFKPLLGTAPNCTLLPVDGSGNPLNSVYANGSPDVVPGDLVWTDDGGNDYNPVRFVMTDENGNQYIVNTTTGLEQMKDLNGNVLKVDPYGIHWVNGQQTGRKDVLFTRDSLGRITQIQDPAGNLYHYTYGASGDLLTFADPVMASKGQKVVYNYNTTHGLISVKDPTGHTQVRTDYDASGRKIDSVDAFGNKITYSYNLDTNSEAVTDRTGQPIQYQYDNRGNILQQTDALGNVTKYTYDQYDNRTSELLPGNQSPTTFIYGDPNNPRLVTQEIVPNPNGSTHNLTTTYTYDAQGQVLTLIDPRGIQITNTYTQDGHFNLNTSQVGSLPPSVYSYDANGNVVKQTDPQGIETDSVYDSNGNMTSQTVAIGTSAALKTDYTYDANGNRTTQTVHNSTGDQTTIYQYDTKNRLVETIYPDGTNSQTTLDSLGNVVGTQDQDGRVTSTFYNARSEAATIQYNFDGTSQVTGYDADGRPATVTDRGGRTTITTYNAAGFGTGDIYQDGSRVIIQPDAQGRAATITDENNKVTVTEYDDAGRQIAVITGFGTSGALETDYTYDEDGNVKTKIVGGRLQSTNTYDDQNRLTRVDYPDGTFETSEWDNDGRNTALVDQANKRTEYSFDGQARLTEVRQVTSGGTFKTDYSIDSVGNELTQVDANSHQTSFVLNSMNRRTSRQLPDGRTETYGSYDGVGNLLQKKDFAGNQFTYGYDGSNHLTSVGGPSVALGFTFDNAQYRVVMNDASGATTFHHDERNFLTGQISPAGWGTLNFTNYGNGQVNTVSSTNPNGNNLTYQMDALNRPATILDGVKTTLMGYDGVGNLADVVQPDGMTLVYGYDTLNHLTAVTVMSGSGVLGGYTYTLGLAGNRVNVQEASGRAVSWLPDDLYRLTGEIITSPNNADPTGTVGYVLDNVGNRQQRTSSVSPIGMQNFTGAYDTTDELKPTFSFDQNGNQTSDANGFTYTYNALNQLTRVQGTGVDVSYLYDGDGLRVQKTNNLTGVVTNYLWDRNNLTGIPQVSEELQNGQVVRRYVYGPRGPLYQVQLVGNTWVTSYFAADATGSIRLVLDDSGHVTDAVDYDGFGNILRRTGTTSFGPGFQGEYTEPETGLVYLRARWYNPAEGRFMGMDSYEGDTHDPLTLHKYVGFADDPQDKTDPSGNDFDESVELTAPREGELLKGDLLAGGRWPVDLLFTSQRAQNWIKAWEGIVIRAGMAVLYNDAGGQINTPLANKVGNATIGWGHLVHTKPIDPKKDAYGPNAHWTLDHAQVQFLIDVSGKESYIRHNIHVPLKQQEFDALEDLVFNRGNFGFFLPTYINAGAYDQAPRYFYSGDIPFDGRRVAESNAFATGIYMRHGQSF